MNLFTKNGKPLQVVEDKVYSRSGILIGRIIGEMVHGTDGTYVGSITRDRLVYRSSLSGITQPGFSGSNRPGSSRCNVSGALIDGDEPNIPD